MKNFIIVAIAIVIAIVLFAGSWAHPWEKGIVVLPHYPEGVVLCGESTTINAGHEDDWQVAQLQEVASMVCPTAKLGTGWTTHTHNHFIREAGTGAGFKAELVAVQDSTHCQDQNGFLCKGNRVKDHDCDGSFNVIVD